MPKGSLLGRVALHFDPKSAYVPEDLSAASRAPDGALWLAADERAAIDVLRTVAPHAHELGDHRCYSLADALVLHRYPFDVAPVTGNRKMPNDVPWHQEYQIF